MSAYIPIHNFIAENVERRKKMGKQIMRVEPIHSMQAFSAKFKHNYRIGAIPNANEAYSHMNEQIIRLPAGETYNTFFEKKLMELP